MEIWLIFSGWLLGAVVIAAVAQAGGRSGLGAFVLCLVFSPLLGAVVTMLLPVKREAAGSRESQVAAVLPAVPEEDPEDELPGDEEMKTLDALRAKLGRRG